MRFASNSSSFFKQGYASDFTAMSRIIYGMRKGDPTNSDVRLDLQEERVLAVRGGKGVLPLSLTPLHRSHSLRVHTVVPHDLLRVAEVSLVVVRVHSHYGKLLVHVGLVGVEVDEHVVQRLKPHRARVHHAADEPGGGARLLEGHQRPRGDHWDDVTEDGGKERGEELSERDDDFLDLR